MIKNYIIVVKVCYYVNVISIRRPTDFEKNVVIKNTEIYDGNRYTCLVRNNMDEAIHTIQHELS